MGKKWVRFSIALLILFLVSASGGFGFLSYLVSGKESLPDIEQPQTSRFYYRDQELMTTRFVENRTKISLNDVAEEVLWATVSVEDQRFFEHYGLDVYGILRAAYQNIREGRVVQGGSTITQQLAKNLFLSHDRTWQRKLDEFILTLQLEKKYSKNEILEKYLNTIYYGHATYGIEAASQLYFDKPASDLSLEEAALLAGLPRGPGYYSPFLNEEAARARQKAVLNSMKEEDFISPEEKKEAINQELSFNENPSISRENNYIVDQVLNNELDDVSRENPDLVQNGGLDIYTTIDPDLQALAEDIMANELPTMRQDEHGVTQPQGALVAMEPDTGKIRAMVGGRDYQETMLNRAVSSQRSPGSSFKPFVYAAALEDGYTPASTFYCEPITLDVEGREDPYEPTDFGGGYHHDELRLREALTVSCNITAIKLNQELGAKKSMEMAQRLGIESPLGDHISLPLGTSEVTLMEITSAYAAFANGGYRVEPLLVEKTRGPDEEILLDNSLQREKVLDENIAYLLTNMLEDVTQPGGTASVVSSILDRPVAGKTGTSRDYENVYMVGYTPDLVVGIYIGDDQGESLQETGGSLAAPVWAEFMKEASSELPPREFTRPDNLVEKTLCPETGQVQSDECTAEAYPELFIKGTEPQKECIEADCPKCEKPPWWHWDSWW